MQNTENGTQRKEAGKYNGLTCRTNSMDYSQNSMDYGKISMDYSKNHIDDNKDYMSDKNLLAGVPDDAIGGDPNFMDSQDLGKDPSV